MLEKIDSICSIKPEQVKEISTENYAMSDKEWRGKLEQTDDLLVMGIRV